MTVSRVTNKGNNVKRETRLRVQKIIDQLGYVPNSHAQALITGKSSIFGLLLMYDISRFPASFLPPILAGLSTKLVAAGYNITLYFDRFRGEKNHVAIDKLNKNLLAGLFVLATENDAELASRIASIDTPIVLINQHLHEFGLCSVISDERAGVFDVINHFVSLGHRHIAFIGGDPLYSTSRVRQEAFIEASLNTGIPLEPSRLTVGNFTLMGGYESMRQILDSGVKTTAVFAANDLMALGAIKMIKEQGLSIPEDIAVAGFDDDPFAAMVDPALTTVHKSRTLMGQEAARLMLRLSEEGTLPVTEKEIVLQPSLIVRESTVGKGGEKV